MPVDTVHQEALNAADRWKKCRDTVDGSDAVKKAGPRYLPKLSEQSISEYEAYVTRAMFFNATGRTLDGVVGMIFRKDPEITGEDNSGALSLVVAKNGKTLIDFARYVTKEVMQVGRLGIMLDAPLGGGNPSFVAYSTESIINWRTFIDAEGQERLQMVVLKEEVSKPKSDDRFMMETSTQYRVLELINGVYIVTVYKLNDGREEVLEGPLTPTVGGRRLEYIPFIFVSPSGTSNGAVEKPPIYDIAEVNIAQYRTSADLEHGRHFTGLPTAWVAGFPAKTKLRVGSTTAWVSEDPNAVAKYLEFTGQGLGTLENSMKEKSTYMAVLGARLLEAQNPKMAEATETHRIRKSGENNIVSLAAKSISEAMTIALRWLGEWRNDFPKKIAMELNTDYVQTKLSSDEILALVKAWQDGAITDAGLVWNFKQGELLPDTIDVDETTLQIKTAREKHEATALTQ